MFGDAHANHFLGGIFLILFSIAFIILFGIFSTNCDNVVCTIPDTTMLQITNIRYAIWVPIIVLLAIGVYMIAGARNNKLMITNKTVIGLWCNIFPIISLTLLVSSCLLYSIINADGFNCGDVKPLKSSKIAYSDLHVSLFHYVTGMITMSGVLFCISVYTLYDFWRETDEQKIEKAKNAMSQFDKIKTLSPGGSAKAGMEVDLIKLKKSLEEGATIDKDNDLEYYNKITEIEDYLAKSKGLEDARNKALQDIEASKISKGSEQQAKSLATVKAKQLLKDFDNITDENEKIKSICKYAKSTIPEEQYIYQELQKTDFYKDEKNKRLINATCSDRLKEYKEELDQEQRVKDYYNEFKDTFRRDNPLDTLGVLEKVCELKIQDSYRIQIFEKIIKHYGESIRNLGLDPTRPCALGGPPGSYKKQVTELIEKLRARTDKPSPPPVQAPPGQASSPASIPQSGSVNIPLKPVSKDSESAKGSQPQAPVMLSTFDTNCSKLALSAVQSSNKPRYICASLGDETNTRMPDGDIFNCLRKHKLIGDQKTLQQLKLECNVSSHASDTGDLVFIKDRQRYVPIRTAQHANPIRTINAEYAPPKLSDRVFHRNVTEEDGVISHYFKTQKKQKAKPKKH